MMHATVPTIMTQATVPIDIRDVNRQHQLLQAKTNERAITGVTKCDHD